MTRKFKRMVSSVASAVLAMSMISSITAAAADLPEGTIIYDFKEATDVSQMTAGETYFFAKQQYGENDAVASLPIGSAVLLFCGAAANGFDDAEATEAVKNHVSNFYEDFSSCAQKDKTDGYVYVKTAGTGFDSCNAGVIAYRDGAWLYGCNYGGVSNVGPFYQYSYTEGKFTADDLNISMADGWTDPDSDSTEDKIVTNSDVVVKVDVGGGRLVAIPFYTVSSSDSTINPSTGDTDITITVGDVTKTIKVFGIMIPEPEPEPEPEPKPEPKPVIIPTTSVPVTPVTPYKIDLSNDTTSKDYTGTLSSFSKRIETAEKGSEFTIDAGGNNLIFKLHFMEKLIKNKATLNVSYKGVKFIIDGGQFNKVKVVNLERLITTDECQKLMETTDTIYVTTNEKGKVVLTAEKPE